MHEQKSDEPPGCGRYWLARVTWLNGEDWRIEVDRASGDQRVQSAAEKWLGAVTVFYALLSLTSIAVAKDALTWVPKSWKWAILGALAVGVVMAALAIITLYSAAYGEPRVVNKSDNKEWAEKVRGVQRRGLGRAIIFTLISLICILVMAMLDWFAPRAATAASLDDVTLSPTGAVLPNHELTPGRADPTVTQANIKKTICVPGWTKRPSYSYTNGLKEKQLASGYTYKGDTVKGDYQEDHLISLGVGGSPKDSENLWPQPSNIPDGAGVKDKLENRLHILVCKRIISLATAQGALETNWWIAYETYGGAAPASAE